MINCCTRPYLKFAQPSGQMKFESLFMYMLHFASFAFKFLRTGIKNQTLSYLRAAIFASAFVVFSIVTVYIQRVEHSIYSLYIL